MIVNCRFGYLKGIVFDSGLFEFDLGFEFWFAVMVLDIEREREIYIYMYVFKFSVVLNVSEIYLYPEPFWFPGTRLLESDLFSKSPAA